MTRTMVLIVWVSVIQLLARGTDLLFSSTPDRVSQIDFGGIEGTVWGGTSVVASLIVLAGIVTHRYPVVIHGSLMCFAVYSLFAWYVMDDTVWPFPPDDWRVFVDHLANAALWLLIAASISFRNGVIKLRKQKQQEEAKLNGLG